MDYHRKQIKKLALRTHKEFMRRCFNITNSIELSDFANLRYFTNKLKEVNDFTSESDIKVLREYDYSDNDIMICSNFYKYDDQFKARILKNKLLSKKLVLYANLKGEIFSPNFENEVNMCAAEYSQYDSDIEGNKRVLDSLPKAKNFHREAWLNKVLRELGFDEEQENINNEFENTYQLEKNRGR